MQMKDQLCTIKIAIGADHRGFFLKEKLRKLAMIDRYQLYWIDGGAHSDKRTDYPQYARVVTDMISNKEVDRGILLCGTGIGMGIAANRKKGMFAAVAWNESIAQRSKEEENANVLVIPADYVSWEKAQLIVQQWLLADFRKERYAERLQQIDF